MALSLDGFSLTSPFSKVPKEHLSEACGTFCASRKHVALSSHDPSHPLNLWIQAKDLTTLSAILNDCAGVIGRTSDGNLRIVSGLRPCGNGKFGGNIGNSMFRLAVGTMPEKVLSQRFVGFCPDDIYSCLRDSLFLEGTGENILSGEVPNFGRSAGNARTAAVPCLLPLEFGHRIEESMMESDIKAKLSKSHPFYADWIESTRWMFGPQSLKGKSLHTVEKITLNQNEGDRPLSSTVYIQLKISEARSLSFKQIYPELERVQSTNVTNWLQANPKPCSNPSVISSGQSVGPISTGMMALQLPGRSARVIERGSNRHKPDETTKQDIKDFQPKESPEKREQSSISCVELKNETGKIRVTSVSHYCNSEKLPVEEHHGDPQSKEIQGKPENPMLAKVEQKDESERGRSCSVDDGKPAAKHDLKQVGISQPIQASNPNGAAYGETMSSLIPPANIRRKKVVWPKDNAKQISNKNGYAKKYLSKCSQPKIQLRKVDHTDVRHEMTNISRTPAAEAAGKPITTTAHEPSTAASNKKTTKPFAGTARKPMGKAQLAPDKKSRKHDKIQEEVIGLLSELHVLGMGNAPKRLLGHVTGYKNTDSKAFKDAFRDLEKANKVTCNGDRVGLSEQSIASIPLGDYPSESVEKQNRMKAVLSKMEKIQPRTLHSIWKVLSDGEIHLLVDLALQVGYTNKDSAAFKTTIKALEYFGLARLPQRDRVQLIREALFPSEFQRAIV